MTTVTISRDFGSEGDILARRIADALGYHYVDKEVIENLLNNYGFVEFDREYESLLGFWAKFDAQRGRRRELMVEMLNKVLLAVAMHGNSVIVGRSGFTVLADFADVFHIRLQAPFESRVQNLMETENLTKLEAETVCEDGDKVRAQFIQDFYGVSWDNARAFDLVINMDKVAADLALEIIVDSVRTLETSPKAGKRTTRTLKIDTILAGAVSDILQCTLDHTKEAILQA